VEKPLGHKEHVEDVQDISEFVDLSRVETDYTHTSSNRSHINAGANVLNVLERGIIEDIRGGN